MIGITDDRHAGLLFLSNSLIKATVTLYPKESRMNQVTDIGRCLDHRVRLHNRAEGYSQKADLNHYYPASD